ncbi:AI-2E family transporter [Breznakiella homolactica]|uniref:AI-2E family transporter n=1 Tax=Breznakiella homolactica TaxID=2798577 RepID=A0A7T8BBC3_9SPIR|nr:AI-2E family transporter [Breznakiella homolactica]QQO09890.1 AI-2E family transporter [Breznakiella homolactica]
MKDRFQKFNSGRANFFLVAFIALIVAGGVLKITASVILPFTIALLLAFVMEPMVRFFGKRGIPRIAGILLAVAIIIVGLYTMGMVLFSSGRTILSLYPKYEDRLTEIYAYIAAFFELPYDEHLTFFENLWGQLGVRTRVRNTTLSLSNTFINFLKDAFMVVLFMVFILVEANHFQEKLDLAFEGERSGKIKKISKDVVRQVTKYLSAKFLISLATGVIVAIGLSLVGLEFPLVWGVIQFILNFIPNIGSIACGVGATLFALLQFWPEPAPIIAVGLIMLGANMIIGNVLEPKIMGDNLGLSPIVVLVSLMIWGWIWGFAGMILAVPMTVIIKILCENIPVLEPLSILLGSHKAVNAKKHEDQPPKNGSGPEGPDSQDPPAGSLVDEGRL